MPANTCFSIRCGLTGESDQVTCCPTHAKLMPAVDGDRVTAYPSEGECEFCPKHPPTLYRSSDGTIQEF